MRFKAHLRPSESSASVTAGAGADRDLYSTQAASHVMYLYKNGRTNRNW